MTFIYDPHLNRTDAIARHFAAAAGKPFSMGFLAETKLARPTVFVNQVGETLPKTLEEITTRAQANGIELSGFAGSDVISLTFDDQKNHDGFMKAMNAYNSNDAATFTVQVLGKSDYWHQAVQKWHEANPHIVINENTYGISEEIRDFTFINLSHAQKFCETLGNHGFDVAAELIEHQEAGVRLEQAQFIDWMPR